MNGRRYGRSDRRLDKADLTPEGFLKGSVPISKIGVFPYRNQDGSMRYELRHPDDVFSKASIDSFRGLPIQVEHNEFLDNPDAVARRKVGQIGDDVHVDGSVVRANVVIDHPDGVSAFNAGVRELSCGYLTDLVPEVGKYDGMPYTHRQTNIRGDHLAITARARLGSDLRLDSADAVEIENHLPQEHPMKKINVDGVEYEVPPQVAIAYEKLTGRADTAERDLATTKRNADTAAATAATEKSTLEGKLAAAESGKKQAEDSLAKLEKEIPARADAMAKERATVLAVGEAVLPAAEFSKVKAADSDVIKTAVIKTAFPGVPTEGKDAAFTGALFLAAADTVKAKVSDSLAANRAASAERHTADNADTGESPADKALAARNKRNADAHVDPMAFGTSVKLSEIGKAK